MTLHQQLKKCNLSPLGLEQRSLLQRYFCTPIGARILFSTGVDGIHYCTVREQGDTIFVVDPSGTPGEYVHPVAANLADFVRLLLSCGGEAALSQAWFMSRERFDAFLIEDAPDAARRAVLDDLAALTGLTPMEEPYAYIRRLQDGFAESSLRFGREYPRDEHPSPSDNSDPFTPPEWQEMPAAPEWKVAFEGSFYDAAGHGRCGTQRPIGRTFDWNGARWHVPAAYVCTRGLVIDALAQIDPEQVASFLSQFDENFSEDTLTDEEQERIIRENPLNVQANAQIVLGGRVIGSCAGSSLVWSPVQPGDMRPDRKAGWVLDHYGFDRTQAWRICRFHFPWPDGKKPSAIRSLSLILSPDEVSFSSPRFTVHAPGDTVTFSHPVTGEVYTLTAEGIVPETLPNHAGVPPYFTRMSCMITPEPPRRGLSIVDCGSSEPVPSPAGGFAPDESAAIGIIGGTDGPTAVMVMSTPRGERKPGVHTACSIPRYAPAAAIEWRVVFHVKLCDDICVELI